MARAQQRKISKPGLALTGLGKWDQMVRLENGLLHRYLKSRAGQLADFAPQPRGSSSI
ncbi:hypothetical protein [Rhizobium leucaenae]|uniref:Uncharacterized protein n=1 Tax=Rhizobium leucaenae TaxID=29450 RepID=A0A7W7ENI8_9HYPH|nr:hypothetical protein [Rhizobium leucaenae]MBB4570333.1 hypothetical protein [Rhizobium leucaenae]